MKRYTQAQLIVGWNEAEPVAHEETQPHARRYAPGVRKGKAIMPAISL